MTTEEKSKKELLLSRLLEGVRGCQSRFGSRTELATEDEQSVRKLCLAFEDVFLHGVKGQQQQEKSKGLWQMTENFVAPGRRVNLTPVSFWPLIKSQLSKHEAERFLLLHNVRSDFGRSRAWLRAALNEHSLERYILILLSLDNLSNYYETWSFFRDPELSAILPQTAAGLGSVLFALVLDNPILDCFVRQMEKNVTEPHIASPVEVAEVADQFLSSAGTNPPGGTECTLATSGSSYNNDKKHPHHPSSKKKKKKTSVNVVSFDEDEPPERSSSSPSSIPKRNSPLVDPTEAKVKVESVLPVTYKDKNKGETDDDDDDDNNTLKSLGHSSSSRQPGAATPVQIISTSSNLNKLRRTREEKSPGGIPIPPPEISIYSSSVKSVDCISVNSVYSDCSERLDLDNLSLTGIEISSSQRLKPVRDRGGNLTNGESENDPDYSSSQDLIPVPNFDSWVAPELLDLQINFPNDEDLILGKVLSPATPSCCSEPTSISHHNKMISDSDSSKDNPTITTTAEVGSSDGSQHTEERIQRLKVILDREVETVAMLRAELAEERRKSTDQIKIFEAKVDSLTKENEVLKHQLKKYIGAVQLLKKEGAAAGANRRTSSFDDEDHVLFTAAAAQVDNNADDSQNEAAEYERKLIQVAEMHGELMEFNAHLQKSLRKRDTIIGRLREELVDLRGPLAAPILSGDEEDADYESWDIVDSSSNDSRGRSVAVRRIALGFGNERVLINIWIPSAFLTGATNDLHHVYQVFLRIKDTEWNVYRRYSQFYSLHRDLKKRDSVIGTFYFPPKKHLGNKDGKFVDERRRKLQEYLRKVMNHTLQTNSILAAHPDKNLLISIFPFFGESSLAHSSQKPKRERSRSRNLFFLASSSSSSNTAQNQTQISSSGFHTQINSSQYPQYTGL